jgi:simple sugar transport system ATP-binding protein
MGVPRLELRGIRKAYPTVVANDGIDLAVAPGEIHAVIGENGAGKSTLMKIIYGMVRPDAGDMLWEGREALVRSPADAQRLGIGMVFQHFALFDTLTVAQNIALASPARGGMEQLSEKIAAIAQRYGLPLEPDRPVTPCRPVRAASEIVRALMQAPGLLIMDEPTSVPTPQALRSCSRPCARSLPRGAASPSATSWKRSDVCDCATVLRAGKVTGLVDFAAKAATMARMMIGASCRRSTTATRRWRPRPAWK